MLLTHLSYWDNLQFGQYHLLEITRYTEAGKHDRLSREKLEYSVRTTMVHIPVLINKNFKIALIIC